MPWRGCRYTGRTLKGFHVASKTVQANDRYHTLQSSPTREVHLLGCFALSRVKLPGVMRRVKPLFYERFGSSTTFRKTRKLKNCTCLVGRGRSNPICRL